MGTNILLKLCDLTEQHSAAFLDFMDKDLVTALQKEQFVRQAAKLGQNAWWLQCVCFMFLTWSLTYMRPYCVYMTVMIGSLMEPRNDMFDRPSSLGIWQQRRDKRLAMKGAPNYTIELVIH